MSVSEMGTTLFEILEVKTLQADPPWIQIEWNGRSYWVKEETSEVIPDTVLTFDVQLANWIEEFNRYPTEDPNSLNYFEIVKKY